MNIEKETFENLIMELVVNGGAAKSGYIEAIHFAREGDYEGAAKATMEAGEAYKRAHDLHFKMISEGIDAAGAIERLLLIHAEDQLNSAETFKEVSMDMIDLYQAIRQLSEKQNRKESI